MENWSQNGPKSIEMVPRSAPKLILVASRFLECHKWSAVLSRGCIFPPLETTFTFFGCYFGCSLALIVPTSSSLAPICVKNCAKRNPNGTYRKNVNCWSNYNWSVKDMDAQNVDFMLFFPIESCFPPFSNRLWKRSENGSENELKSARASTLRLKKAENGSQKLKNWTWKRVNGAWLLEDGSHVARSEAGMWKKASRVPGPQIPVHQCRRTRPACTTSAGCPAGLPGKPGRDVVQIYW